jgi:hypothetical protein
MVQIDADTAVRTWLAYNRQVVAYSGAHPDDTALVSVRRLTGDSTAVADELQQRLELPLTPVPIDGTYDATLLATAAPARPVPDWAAAEVAEVEEALAQLSGARLPAYA